MSKFQELYESIIGEEKANSKLQGPEGTHSIGQGFYGKEDHKPLFRKVGGKFEKIDQARHEIKLDWMHDGDQKSLERKINSTPGVEGKVMTMSGPGGGHPVVHLVGNKHSLIHHLKKHYTGGDAEEAESNFNDFAKLIKKD